MKLVYCPECRDVVRLIHTARRCSCWQCQGFVNGQGVAHYTGPAVPLEIPDVSIRAAMADDPKKNGPRMRIVLYRVNPREIEKEEGSLWHNGKARVYTPQKNLRLLKNRLRAMVHTRGRKPVRKKRRS